MYIVHIYTRIDKTHESFCLKKTVKTLRMWISKRKINEINEWYKMKIVLK